jgi:hypothetical protein
VLAVVLASVIGLLLADGSSGPGVNVAAAAYAATSADGGVVEAQFVEHLFSRGRITATLHSREWIDTSTGRRRSQRFLPHAVLRHGQPVAFEIATTPGWTELWNGSEEGPEVIRRFRARPLANKNLAGGAVQPPASESPAEVQLERRQTIEGVTLYRQLYQEGSVKLVGRERLHGRLLWKLEGYTGFAFHSLGAHAKAQPIIAAVVLVDPQTYLPVIERQINLLAPGHPVQVESELLTYRRLPAGAASEALLSLSKQHPGARVLTSAPARPGSRP